MSDEQDIVKRLRSRFYMRDAEQAASLIERLRVELDAAQQVNRANHDELARLRQSLAREARHD